MSHWKWSKTHPVFFFLKYINKYGRQRSSKFWPKWAVAGRLVEQRPKFLCQFSTNLWWTHAENFKTISWLLFELLLNDWKFVVTNGLLLYTFLIFVQQEAICCNKFSVNQQLIKDGWRYLLEIFSICSSPDCAKLTKKFRPLLNQPASHCPFRPKLWTSLATVFVDIS